MKRLSIRRLTIVIAAATCLAVPAAAQADYTLPDTFRTDTAQSGGDAGNRAPHDVIVGDDIMSHPGMPGMPKYDPPTRIEVVRPERTIVRDVDESLPLILSSAALLLALAGAGVAVMRTRMTPRPGH